jgi:tRNA(Met) cytidine acetyltransferase
MTPTDLATLSALLRQRRHRGLLWINADHSRGERLLGELVAGLPLAPDAGVLLGERSIPGLTPLPGRRGGEVLGRTLEWAVYDAFSGFNPNHFAQLAGTVAAGGWLILLSPPAQEWPDYPDPEYARLCVEPWTPETLTPRFLRRLVATLLADEGVTRLSAERLLPARWRAPAVAAQQAEGLCRSVDQQRAVARIRALTEQRRAALVMTADRGRGKSAAIGLALAQLAGERPLRVVVTAPSWQAIESLRERLEAQYAPLHWHAGECRVGELTLLWRTPAQLQETLPPADLLIIDEAAAVATPLLALFARHYRRLLFATTQHGYEGNGRGFALRFRAELARRVPALEELELTTPIRWAPDDPLEATLNRALLLDAEPPPSLGSEQSVSIMRIDRDALLNDETLLRELFGLLVLAHYRTTPGDLRVLLDSPNLDVWLLRVAGVTVGCALIAREGELSAAFAEAVWQGVRRPTGHLLPQALIAHEGYEEVAPWRAWRVVRIAVHPSSQQQGLGTELIDAIAQAAVAQAVDYLGASFAAAPDLLRYWRRNGFEPVRVGDQLDAVSGSHAVIVLRPLSARCRQWFPLARRRYMKRLRYRLSGALAQLPVELLPGLFEGGDGPALEAGDLHRLVGFAQHRRSLESTLIELDRLLLATVPQWPALGLAGVDQQLLVARIWQQKGASQIPEPQGAKAQLQRLRELAACLLEQVTPAP